MGLTLVTARTAEPIELEEAKHQFQQNDETDLDDDKCEQIWIPAARGRCEKATERQTTPETWDLYLPRFPWCHVLELPKPPLQSVTWVKYLDANGVLQT